MSNSFHRRYDGSDLGKKPHIAILGSYKVGNFVVTIPLLRLLRIKYPESIIDFWGSEVTRDFEEALCEPGQPLNWRFSWDIKPEEQPLNKLSEASIQREKSAGPIDLLINCDGFNPLTQTLASWLNPRFIAGGSLDNSCRNLLSWGTLPNQKFLADNDWDSVEFITRYKDIFNSNYIAELLCRMAFLNPSHDDLSNINLPWKKPSFSVPDILIHCTTARAAKLWPFEHWDALLKSCKRQNIKAGLIGAAPSIQETEYHSGNEENKLISNHIGTLIDLRGKTSLIELAGASLIAKAVLSVDAGPMHIAAGVGTPTLAIVGNDKNGIGVSPIRLWLPRNNCIERTISTYTSYKFSANSFKNDDIEEAKKCMSSVAPSQVISWLGKTLGIAF